MLSYDNRWVGQSGAVSRFGVPLVKDPGGTRTRNRSFVKGVLCPLSYEMSLSFAALHLGVRQAGYVAQRVASMCECSRGTYGVPTTAAVLCPYRNLPKVLHYTMIAVG